MYEFFTDHYFHMGHAHYSSGKPCQDYSLSSSSGSVACAIVSDGCSTGRHTDVGARVLTFSTLQAVRDHIKAMGDMNSAAVSVVSRQQQIIGSCEYMLGLIPEDMYASCVYVYLVKSSGMIHVQGDGVFAIKFADGSIEMHRVDWAKNAPFYPYYTEEDEKKYIANLHKGQTDTARMTHTVISVDCAGNMLSKSEYDIPFEEGKRGLIHRVDLRQLSTAQFIAVFSDGINQIGKLPDGGDTVQWYEAVFKMLSFKSMAGEFAKRRMLREIRDLGKINKGPIDDISYAVVRIEEIEEGEKTSG
jgi:hypothetical protein